MDDLIDSMARRHLAHRRFDVCMKIFRLIPNKDFHFRLQLINNDKVMDFMVLHSVKSNHHPDFQFIVLLLEPLKTGRTTFRNDDSFYTNRSSRINSNGFNQRLRSRIDYYNRIQPDLDHVRMKIS